VASPTVEMGLGGSLRSLAAKIAPSKFSSMRNWSIYSVDTFQEYLVIDGLHGSWLQDQKLLGVSPAATRNAPSVLPDGGVAVVLNGVDQSIGSGNFGAPLNSPVSIEAILAVAAVPGVGVEPAIWGASGFGLTYRNDGRAYGYYNGAAVVDTPVSTGVTTHLALTRSGAASDVITLYKNGVSVATATIALASLSLGDCYAGKHWTNAQYLSATYYFLAVYAATLSAGQVAANYAALSWTDVTADTLGSQPLTYERGIRDDSPSNRVASTGTLTFAMNNLGSNSGGVTGYYSPGHASCRTGFGKGTPIRVKTGSDVQFIGRVRTIAPAPGKIGNGVVKVMAADYIDACALSLMETTTIMEDVRGDEVFRVIVGRISNQPNGVTTYPGTEVYPLVLDNTRDESVSALTEFHRLAASECGLVYVNRTGALVYEARSTRIGTNPTSSATLADTMHGLDVAEVSSSSLNRVQITVHPRVVDTAATTVLFATANPIQIAAGETKTIIGPYRTPSVPGVTTRVGGLSMVTPVATTDYLMNTLSDGTGADLTASLTVTANYGANGVQLVLVSAATQPSFITRLQCRGKGVYDFRTVVVKSQDDADVAAYGVNSLTLDMVYQQDPNVAQSIADYLRTAYGDLSGTRVKRVMMLPDAAGMPANILTRDISDRVTVSETITGASGDYYINGVKHEFQNGTLPTVTWWLSPASAQSYWILDLVGASELDSNAILAPA